MSLHIHRHLITIFFLLLLQSLSAQTQIWLEDFSGAPPAPGWDDSNFTDCDGTAGSFNGVAGNRYEITDMEGAPCCPLSGGGGNDNEWVTNDITITGFCNVTISVDYGFSGAFECSAGGPYFGCNGNPVIENGHDQMVFEYSINGGGWIQFGYVCGGVAGTASINGLTGNTIRVRVRPANKSTGETYWFDNVRITGVEPEVNPINDVTACAGSPVNVAFTSPTNPTPTFNWTNDNTAIGLAASGTGNISFTPPANLGSQEVATITVTPSLSGCDGAPETFMITVNPLPQTDDPADVVACSGDMVDIHFTGDDPNATYHWTVNGIPNNPLFPPNGTGDISGTVPPLPFAISGTVTVHAESNGCIGPPQTFNVNLYPAISATFTMTSSPDLCEGQSATFSVNFSGGSAPFTFTYAIDGVEQPPLNTNSDPFTFSVPLNADATISAVRFTAGNGCVQDVTGTFDINVTPTPTAMLDPGSIDLCAGDDLNLTVDFNGSDNYTVTYTINGALQPSVDLSGPSDMITVTPGVGTTIYALTAVNSNGCTGTASGSFEAVVTALPSAIISGNPVICSGQNASVSVTLSGSTPWTFVYSIDGIEQTPVTTSNSPYIITATYTATTTLELVSVATGNCDGTTGGIAVVSVQPGVTGILASGTNAVCTGLSDTLDFSFTGAGPYTFTYSINGAPQAPITTANNTYQLVVSPGATSTYTLTNVSNGSCPGGTASGTYTLNVTSPPTATLSGTDTICAEHSAMLSVAFTGTAPWTFSYTANGVIRDTITTSSNPYILTVSPTATTTYGLSAVSSGSCVGSVSGTATIKVNPNPTVTLSGGGQICQGGSGTDIVFTFTGTAPWSVTYKANNDTITLSSNTSPLVVPVNPNIGTIYSLIEVSDSLCTDTAVGTVAVFVFTPATAQFLGTQTFCDSASTTVSIDFTGTGPFIINYTINGIAQQPDTTDEDPYIIPVNVNTTTTYALTSIQSPGCNGIITGNPAVITVHYEPTYANLNLNCNAANGTYVVTFDVLGATLPLTFIGGNAGSFSGTTWTSNPIPQSSGYSFTFRDANNCGNVTVSGPSTCNCTTEAGTMDLAPIQACQSQVITANYNGGFVNDGNDTLLYILHSTPALPVGTIYGWNNQPTFGFLPGMSTGTTYYISAIAGNILNGLVDTADLCVVISQGTPVSFFPLPLADLGMVNTDVCNGASLDLNVTFTGVSPFSFTPAFSGVPQAPITNITANPYTWTLTPTGNVSVTLNAVTDANCPNGTVSGMADIMVHDAPAIGNLQSVCDYNTATYVVTFDITTGTAPFTVSGISGNFSGNSFTSDPIPFASQTFNGALTDTYNCGQAAITGMANCNCISNAGNMSQTQINACANTVLSVPAATGTVLDPDDQLMYILHTNPGVPVGTILAWSATPDFNFAGAMLPNTTYYVSAVVGNPDGNGMIDLQDPCLSINTGTPVRWLPTPTATLMPGNYNLCPGQTQSLFVSLTGTPNFSLGYTNNGNPFTVTATQTAFLLNATLQQTATFVLTTVSDANCTGTVNGTAVVNVHQPPVAGNYVSNCDPATQTYVIEFDITQGDIATMNVASPAGTYNPLTGHFVSNPIVSGQPYTVSLTDSWNCGSYTLTDSVSCVCLTNAGIMDNTPLTLCAGQTASVSTAAGANILAGDTLVYLLVAQNSLPPNWTILASSSDPVFNFNPVTMTSSTPYQIVAVAGNIGGVNGVNLSDPCLSITPGPVVTWRPPVTAALSGTTTVCPGSPASIEVDFGGDGPFNLVYTNGVTNFNQNNVTQDPLGIQVNPTLTTGYNLVSVTGAGNCPGAISGSAMVTVSTPPQVLNLMVDCDLATETYTLTFNVGNGAQNNPVYTVLGIQGAFSDTTFTSVSYPGTQPYTFVVSNPTGCTTTASGMPNCVCTTNVGTLSNPVNGCLPVGTVSAQLSGNQTLDPEDMITYILCTDPAILPMGILAQNTTPEFGFQTGMMANQTYYIVAVAGNSVNGSLDLTDPCLSTSPGVPVSFRNGPTASISGDATVCVGDNASFQVQLNGSGPYSFVYAINGVPQAQVTTPAATFNILSNNLQQDQVFTLISVTDAFCPGTVDGQATLTAVEGPQGDLLGSATICAGDTTALSLQLSGGTGYNLTINGPNPPLQLNNIQNGYTFSVAPGATTVYTITALSATGNTCPADIGDNATVTVSSLSATTTPSNYNGFNTSCPLTSDGSITVTPSGGIAPLNAQWSNGATGLVNGNLMAGSYSLTLTDNIGCTFTDSVSLQSPPELGIELEADAPNCFGSDDGVINITGINGGAGPFAISLDGAAVTSTSTFPYEIAGLDSGDHLVEVEDANGCVSDAGIEVPTPAELIVNLGQDTTIHLGDSLVLQGIVTTPHIASLTWTPTLYLSTPDSLITVCTPVNSTIYTLLVTDDAGCTASDQLRVLVDRTRRVYIPNILEPESDILNNIFTVFAAAEVAKVRRMAIYDRWGEELFLNKDFLPNDPDLGWDGRYKGEYVNPGVFVYVVEVEYIDGTTEIFAGDLTVIR